MINAARNNRSTAFRTLLLDALLQFVLYRIEYCRFTCHLFSTGDFSRRSVRRPRGAAVNEHFSLKWKNRRRNRPSRRNSAQSCEPLALKMRLAHRAVPCQLQVHNLSIDQRNSRRRGFGSIDELIVFFIDYSSAIPRIMFNASCAASFTVRYSS